MGRTIPTHRMAVDMTERKFKDFRRALRSLDRERMYKIIILLANKIKLVWCLKIQQLFMKIDALLK